MVKLNLPLYKSVGKIFTIYRYPFISANGPRVFDKDLFPSHGVMQPLRWPFTYLQRLHAHLGASSHPTSSPVGRTETVTPAMRVRREEEDEDNSSVTEEKMTKVGNWQEGFFCWESVLTGWWQLWWGFFQCSPQGSWGRHRSKVDSFFLGVGWLNHHLDAVWWVFDEFFSWFLYCWCHGSMRNAHAMCFCGKEVVHLFGEDWEQIKMKSRVAKGGSFSWKDLQ